VPQGARDEFFFGRTVYATTAIALVSRLDMVNANGLRALPDRAPLEHHLRSAGLQTDRETALRCAVT
jgi:hypothetical protein